MIMISNKTITSNFMRIIQNTGSTSSIYFRSTMNINKTISRWSSFLHTPRTENLEILIRKLYNKQFVPCRTIQTIGKKFSCEEKYKLKDKISSDYELIFRLKSERYYRFASSMSISGLVAVILLYIRTLYKATQFDDYNTDELFMKSASIMMIASEEVNTLIYIMAALISTWHYAFLIRNPVRIYRNGKDYIAIYMHRLFPLINSQRKFTTVKQSFISKKLNTNVFKCNGRRTRMDVDDFKAPIDFYRMTS